MAPELYTAGAIHDEKVDIWAVGIIAFQLLSGNQLPFRPTEEQEEDPDFDF